MRPTINAYGERVTERAPTRKYIAGVQARIAIERQRKIDAHREKAQPPTRHYLETERPRRTRVNDPIPDTLELPMIALTDRPGLNGHAKTCADCRNPVTSKNGRCYRCKPSGNGQNRKPPSGDARERNRERDRLRQIRRTAEKRAAAQSGKPTPSRAPAPYGELERQLTAIQAVAAAIDGLSPEATAWVLAPFVRQFSRLEVASV